MTCNTNQWTGFYTVATLGYEIGLKKIEKRKTVVRTKQ